MLYTYAYVEAHTEVLIKAIARRVALRIIDFTARTRYLTSTPAITAAAQSKHRLILIGTLLLTVSGCLICVTADIFERLRRREAAFVCQ